ncbi:hypothetical protein DFH08DRAFT_851825 [Mycena albidolilacea]|uniref:Survival protein SurE-like phosphatase/nucleotidase domain-containing protein n=1 Tax=Mycena albidolilacea TaxID=1033008 RepID=A0AAD7F094_9AGAR|nr:hypothetical protein DFH08DRAFT_851825 [Mycena albidolilacea]
MKVLLINDDGPPDDKASPYIFSFYNHLVSLGWNVKVVLPSSQKSWIGKYTALYFAQKPFIGVLRQSLSYHRNNQRQIFLSRTRYIMFPLECILSIISPDGLGKTSPTSRPLEDGEVVSLE